MSTKSDIESGAIPDKEYLYGHFQKGEDWITKFGKKLAYKSQDLADDDVNINQNRTGMGWKELAVIAFMLLGGLGIYQMGQGPAKDSAPITPAPPAAPPRSLDDSEYEVRFFDANGNPISVPHISQIRTKPIQ